LDIALVEPSTLVNDETAVDGALPPPASQFDPVVSTAGQPVYGSRGSMRDCRTSPSRQGRGEEVASPGSWRASDTKYTVIEPRPLQLRSSVDLTVTKSRATRIGDSEDSVACGRKIEKPFVSDARHRRIMPNTCDNSNRRE